MNEILKMRLLLFLPEVHAIHPQITANIILSNFSDLDSCSVTCTRATFSISGHPINHLVIVNTHF